MSGNESARQLYDDYYNSIATPKRTLKRDPSICETKIAVYQRHSNTFESQVTVSTEFNGLFSVSDGALSLQKVMQITTI